jgi:vitellogenic carboxypeptidase-like protein
MLKKVILVLLMVLYVCHCQINAKKPVTPMFLQGRKLVDSKLGHSKEFLTSLPKKREPQLINGSNPFEFSGYISVNASANAQMYYVYFPAQNGNKNAPLIMWLQGGPGCSSMDGLFVENGPYHIDPNTLRLIPNEYTWNKEYSMVFVDNPVGAGFSYVDADGYVTNEVQVAEDMFIFLNQFLPRYNLTKNELYIFGESYAGKYIPSIAHRIHFDKSANINLRGAGIGDGLTHPVQQFVDYAEFAFNTGLIDQKQYKNLVSLQNVARDLIMQQKWNAAMQYCNEILGTLVNYAGGVNVYDIRAYGDYDLDYVTQYVMQPDVREQMHTAGHRDYHDCDSETYAKLQADMPKSVRQYVIDLLNDNFRIILYNGQFDLIINTPAAERWIYDMPWNGQVKYQLASKTVWKENDNVAGYARVSGPLTQVTVLKAGHLSPMDQPQNLLSMVNKFIRQQPF